MIAMTKLQAAGLVLKIAKAIRRDLDNRYSLIEPFQLPPVSCDWWPERTFDNELLRVTPDSDHPGHILILVKPFVSTKERNIFDGATLAPDAPFGEKAVLTASLVHDVIYFCGGELATFAGVEDQRVRDFADTMFREMLDLLCRRRWLAWAYFLGVRLGFPWFQAAKKAVKGLVCASMVAGGLLALSGCAGCQWPLTGDGNGHFVEGTTAADFQQPAIVKESP